MENAQVFGQVLRDCRSKEVLVGLAKRMDREGVEVGWKVMENKRLRAQGDGEVSRVGEGLKFRGGMGKVLVCECVWHNVKLNQQDKYFSASKIFSFLFFFF